MVAEWARRVGCIALSLSLAVGPAWAEDCSSAGTRAFRTEGVDAALSAFTAARARAECRGDAQLAFNYARSLQGVLDRDGDDRRVCDAAEAYAQAATADSLPGAVRALAAKGRSDLATRCEALRQPETPGEDYETLVTRARAQVREGDKAAAAEAWKGASRLKPDAALPHRALCSLLPDLDRADEGRGHCRQWRALEPATAPATVPAAGPRDHTLTWILAGAAAVSLGAGGLLYGEALSAADDADRARAEGEAARVAEDAEAYAAADVKLTDASGRAERAQLAAFVLWGAGAVLAGWAIWRVVDDDGAGTALYFDGRGVGIYGRF